MLDAMLQDIRYALRALRTSPGFACVAILSLALGIGANTAIFSLIDAVMLRYLPVSHPEELVQVTAGTQAYLSNPVWEQLSGTAQPRLKRQWCTPSFPVVCPWQGRRQKPIVCPSVPSMGRILLDERSQPEPMMVTVANRKA